MYLRHIRGPPTSEGNAESIAPGVGNGDVHLLSQKVEAFAFDTIRLKQRAVVRKTIPNRIQVLHILRFHDPVTIPERLHEFRL